MPLAIRAGIPIVSPFPEEENSLLFPVIPCSAHIREFTCKVMKLQTKYLQNSHDNRENQKIFLFSLFSVNWRPSEARNNVLMHDSWIVRQNIRLAPTLSYQADDELDGKPGAADDGLASEHVRVKSNARMIGHWWSPLVG
jgi:hypothetical protein